MYSAPFDGQAGLILLVRRRLSLRVGYFENEFSGVLALEELQQRFGERFEAVYDVLARFEFAGRHPVPHLLHGLSVTIRVVKYHHTFHAGAINQKRQIVRRSFDWRRIAVLRNCAADDHSCAARELRKRSVEDVATHVVEINVNAIRAMLAQRLADILGLVVNGGVEAQLLYNVIALLAPAGDAYHFAAFYFGDLSNDHSYRSGGA